MKQEGLLLETKSFLLEKRIQITTAVSSHEKNNDTWPAPGGKFCSGCFFSLDSRQRPQSVSWPRFAWESPSHVITGRDASRESAAWKFAFSRQRPRGVTWKAIFTRMAEAAPSEQHCLVSNTHWRLTKKALWLN